MRFYLPLLLFSGLFLLACSPARRAERFYSRDLPREILRSPVFSRSFTGFVLVDAQTGRKLCDINGDKQFIPASTVKILTLYTCLHLLGDSLPGMRYWLEDSTLVVVPTADPTFLHPKFQAWQPVFQYWRHMPARQIQIRDLYWRETPLGPGWAWDDANEGYSPERISLPLYGNVKRVFLARPDSIAVEPAFWQLSLVEKPLYRTERAEIFQEPDNTIYYDDYSFLPKNLNRTFAVREAFYNNKELLDDTLHRDISWMRVPPQQAMDSAPILYSVPVDTVYRRMMHQSDNFLAEQLILVCAGSKYGRLEQKPVLDWVQDTLLQPAGHAFRWVDGSGLSRYNLNTPRNLTSLLDRLWREQPHDRLLSFFPVAGQPATTLDWYKPLPGQPYLYAKTGSMSGVQNMAGYIITKRGKVLIFSFMNTNFVGPGKPWREEMRRILELIHGL